MFLTSRVYETIKRHLDHTLDGANPPPPRMSMIPCGGGGPASLASFELYDISFTETANTIRQRPTRGSVCSRQFTLGIPSLSSCLPAGTGLIKVSPPPHSPRNPLSPFHRRVGKTCIHPRRSSRPRDHRRRWVGNG